MNFMEIKLALWIFDHDLLEPCYKNTLVRNLLRNKRAIVYLVLWYLDWVGKELDPNKQNRRVCQNVTAYKRA